MLVLSRVSFFRAVFSRHLAMSSDVLYFLVISRAYFHNINIIITFGLITSQSPSLATMSHLCMTLSSIRVTKGVHTNPWSLSEWSPNALVTASTPPSRSANMIPCIFLIVVEIVTTWCEPSRPSWRAYAPPWVRWRTYHHRVWTSSHPH